MVDFLTLQGTIGHPLLDDNSTVCVANVPMALHTRSHPIFYFIFFFTKGTLNELTHMKRAKG